MTASGEAVAALDGRDLRRLRHLAGRVCQKYGLIADGDTVLAAVSGGKDSLVMTKFLADLRRRAPVKYRLGAVHLGPGREGALGPWLAGLRLDFIHWEPAPAVPELESYRPGQPSPCFNCARLRRNRLFELARQYGAGRLALGHHLDDAQETLLMNMFFSGRLEGITPAQRLFDGRLTIIRPLFLVPEVLIRRLVAGWELPVLKSACPADGHTIRQVTKDWVADLAESYPQILGHLAAVVEAEADRREGGEAPGPAEEGEVCGKA